MGATRREVLLGLASAGAAVAGAALPTVALAEDRKTAPPDAVGMLYDATRCIGCKSCVVACREANGLAAATTCSETRGFQGRFDAPVDLDSGTKNIIKLYKEGADVSYMKSQCMHCVDPACTRACMLGALKKRELGIVTWQADKCVGCRYCVIACPFGCPKTQWESLNPCIVKCEMCYPRVTKGQQPACCEVCPRHAVIFGKLEDLKKEAHRRLAESPSLYVNKVYGEEDGGGTQVLYLSHVPFEKLGLPDLGVDPPGKLAREVQHAAVGGFVLPLALWTALSGIVWRNKRVQEARGGAAGEVKS